MSYRFGQGRTTRLNGKGKGFRIWILGHRRFVVDLYDSEGKRPIWCQDRLKSHEAAVAWIEDFVKNDPRWRRM